MTSNEGSERLAKLETMLATLDEVVQLAELDSVTRAIARGFVEIGAVMSIIMVEDGEVLRVAARWPEPAADDLFERAHGGELGRFVIPLAEQANPYVRILRTKQPKFMAGPEEVADHIMATYSVEPSKRPIIMGVLHGRASAVLPLVAGDRAVGVAGINYREDLQEGDLHFFNIFAASAATVLNFKRDIISKEAILADLELALEKEREARRELSRAERLAALGEMAAVVAHEIRNPLGVIANALTPLRRQLPDTERAHQLVDFIDEETRRIDRTVRNMLAFSSPMERQGERLDPVELVKRAIRLTLETAASAGPIELEREDGAAPPSIVAEPDLITQALVNLMGNALEATARGEPVRVKCSTARRDDQPCVRIAVIDSGRGIAAEHLSDVYKPFFTTKSTGTGLGLAIVKRIVDAHGGRIELKSTPGKGTTVVIELPAAHAQG